jgi:nucleoside-diphosphate-sugar epimerase
VGAVLCRRLLRDGGEVHVILKPTTSTWRLDEIRDDLRIHAGDLRDEVETAALVAAARPEVVYHLATHGAYPFQTDADVIIQANILGTWNLLKALSSIDYQVFVNTGSSSEYGFKQYAMRENDLLEPNSYYSVAKCAQTLLCQHVARQENHAITTFRLFSTYGPFEEPSRLVPTLVRRCLAGEDLHLVAADTARDFVYVDDVVDAYLRIDALTRLQGEILNIGTGVQRTVREVVDLVLRHTGSSVRCGWGEMPSRIWDTSTWVADCTKARRLLGWEPATSLSDGLALTVAWARARSSA